MSTEYIFFVPIHFSLLLFLLYFILHLVFVFPFAINWTWEVFLKKTKIEKYIYVPLSFKLRERQRQRKLIILYLTLMVHKISIQVLILSFTSLLSGRSTSSNIKYALPNPAQIILYYFFLNNMIHNFLVHNRVLLYFEVLKINKYY